MNLRRRWRIIAQGEQREPWVSEGQPVEPPTGATEPDARARLGGSRSTNPAFPPPLTGAMARNRSLPTQGLLRSPWALFRRPHRVWEFFVLTPKWPPLPVLGTGVVREMLPIFSQTLRGLEYPPASLQSRPNCHRLLNRWHGGCRELNRASPCDRPERPGGGQP